MISFKKRLKNIHNKSEEDRIKIMWVAVVFGMIIILSGWFVIYKLSHSNNYESKIANEVSQIPSFSNLQKDFDDLQKQKDETLKEVTDLAQKAEIESVALVYLKENKLVSESDFSNLKLTSIEKLENNWHLEYKQYHQDILVDNSSISFLIDSAEKKVVSHLSNFDSDINLSDLEQKITKEEAYEIAKENLSADLNSKNFDLKNSELVIYKKENKKVLKYYLVWKLNILSLEPLGDYHYFIDVKDGKIIFSSP
ncbi:MAG: PepSY domain-containing protein [Patescibacteria group bacterium]|nr:PepSY domain-containing protein [Patescibacteria group bacterium]